MEEVVEGICGGGLGVVVLLVVGEGEVVMGGLVGVCGRGRGGGVGVVLGDGICDGIDGASSSSSSESEMTSSGSIT